MATSAHGNPETPPPLLSALFSADELAQIRAEDRDYAQRAVNLVYAATRGRMTPRLAQLLCCIALQKKDVVYIAATGSGKTMILAMMLLLNPDSVCVTVSPLKELQKSQVRMPFTDLPFNASTYKYES